MSRLVVTIPFADRYWQNTCLTEFFQGTYGWRNVFVAQGDCVSQLEETPLAANYLVSHRAVTVSDPNVKLVWLQQEAVDASLLNDEPPVMDEFWMSPSQSQSSSEQAVMRSPSTVIYSSPTEKLVTIPRSLQFSIEPTLPRFWKATVLPDIPVGYIPVPQPAREKVQTILDSVKFDPVVASIVSNISIPQIVNDIRFLTGEDEKSNIISRHSFSDGIRIAAEWLKERIDNTGATCELKTFLPGFGPNVICSYPATENTTETILLSAHYDSRGSFGSTRAPGGDDDGSGTVAILSIARTIARKQISFKKNVQLALFAGEEQGLYGSKYYSRDMRSNNASLTLMVQADMLAYHAAGEPPQLGLPDLIGTPEVTQLVAKLAEIYSPELTVGFTPACCSDHQSFHEQGFPSTQVFERAGRIADPMYHNSGDLSDREGYDFDQLKSIAKVQFATLLHSAGFSLPEDDF